MALPTTTDYTTRMNEVELALRNTSNTLTNARSEFEKANNPAVFFTDEERAVRQERALPALEAAEAAATQAVEDALTLASDVTDLTANAAPALNPADEAIAASRAVFVREDVDTLSVRELTQRIRQAALQDDRVSLFLYLRYAPDRLKAQAKASGPYDEGDTPWDTVDTDGDARSELRVVLNDVRDSFRNPDMKQLQDKAVALRGVAYKLHEDVRKRARQNETYVFQAKGEVTW